MGLDLDSLGSPREIISNGSYREENMKGWSPQQVQLPKGAKFWQVEMNGKPRSKKTWI